MLVSADPSARGRVRDQRVLALLLGCIEWPSACDRLEALVIVQNGCSVLATRSFSVGPQQALQFAFTGTGNGRHFPLQRSGLDLDACGIGLKVAVNGGQPLRSGLNGAHFEHVVLPRSHIQIQPS